VVDALSNVLAFEAYDAPLRRQSHAESVHHFTDLWFAQMEAKFRHMGMDQYLLIPFLGG
jgi:hypothetical protein